MASEPIYATRELPSKALTRNQKPVIKPVGVPSTKEMTYAPVAVKEV